MPLTSCPHLVAFDQCGLELQGPNMRTQAKRLIASREVVAAKLGADSLRYHAWDPVSVRARYEGLQAGAAYEVEAAFACESGQRRVMALVAGAAEIAPAITLVPGGATQHRAAVPQAAFADGALDLAVLCREGPDAVVSELRLFSSVPVGPKITVVGDSRGGLIGTVSDAEFAGIAGAAVVVATPFGTLDTRCDALGTFRIPLRERLPAGQHALLTVTATADGLSTSVSLDTRALALGLRELPGNARRQSLAGLWQFLPGRHPDPKAPGWSAAAPTQVPGHVAFDGLIPDRGVATLKRMISLPGDWAGAAVFARFDGAYGRAEVYLNGHPAATHSAGATSFDVDLTQFLRGGDSVLTVVLTEHTPHAVLDYMSWYAHTSLLGIWREAFLFAVPKSHIGPLQIRLDWDDATRAGTVDLEAVLVNLNDAATPYVLAASVLDGGRILQGSTLSGSIAARGSVSRGLSLHLPEVEPWSAEVPRLYDLDLTLTPASGEGVTYRRRIGFRRVQVVGRQLQVNGRPVRLLGVNRHDARMKTGRSMRVEDLRHDVLALRQANVNVIRTAHYPADPRLLELCDELGMYVQDQSPICFAAGFDDHHWTRSNDAAHLVPYVLEVTAETVARDQGHAAVIIWDLANETQWAWGFDAQLAMVRQMDPTRPSLFSFDLNQIGDANPLPKMPPQDRPEIRTYHYPGWDRSWQEDIDWLRSYDQPCVLDECLPPFQDNARAALHAGMLAIDPGVRDYWVTGAQPFFERAMQDTGCIGGMIWSAVDDQWVLPLAEKVGEGNWAHLTKLDYHLVREVHPPQDGLTFRGEGEWGLIDGWGRLRPEMWHVHKAFSPIRVTQSDFSDNGARLDLTILNRHSHRALETLELRIEGAAGVAAPHLVAAPGAEGRFSVQVDPRAASVGVEFWHPEGWLVDAFRWAVPGRGVDPAVALRAGAQPLRLVLGKAGELALLAGDTPLASWPRFHVQEANHPLQALALPQVDPAAARIQADGAIVAPMTGAGWEGSLTVRVSGAEVEFAYACTFRGEEAFGAREIGLAFDLPQNLTTLWWDRNADWTAYPAGHIGRPSGQAAAAPAPANPLRPADRWEADATEAGTNDFRSTKRNIRIAGLSDGQNSLSVLSDGSQHVRAMVSGGRPVLHVLDWYGGVPLTMDTDHIWTSFFGTGQRIGRGTPLQGRVRLCWGAVPKGMAEG